jgi:AsmA protein
VRRLLIAVIAVVFVAALAAPFLVPSGFLKAEIASLVLQKTGRELRIAGPIGFSLLPRIVLTAHDVALASPADGFSTDFLRAPTVEVSLRPLALLRGALEIDRLQLSHPTISFEIDLQGHRNWIFRRASRTPLSASPDADTSGQLFAAGTLTIADGEVTYLDRRDGTRRAASAVTMTATVPRLDAPLNALNAAGTLTYNGEGVELAVTLASPDSLRHGGASGATLSIAAPRGNFAFRGEVGGTGSSSGSGLVELNIPSLRDFLAWVQGAPAAKVSGPLSVSGRLEAESGQFTLSDARIVLDTVAAEGAVTVARTRGRPMISGRLGMERLDLDRFIRPTQEPAPPSAPLAATPSPPSAATPPAASVLTPAWSSAPIDLAPLKLVDLDLSLTANAIRVRRIDVGKSQMTLRVKDGRLDLDIAAMALYGGTGSGKIVADGSGPVPAFGARFNLAGITVRRVPIDIAGLGELSGTGDVSLDLIGRGGSVREIVESLNGIVGVKFADGTIGSAGLGPLMRETLGPAVGDRSIPRAIDYSVLSGTATIARGILRNSDLRLLSPTLSASAAGTLDLRSRRIDYLWQPDIPGVGSARVAVTGSWDAPTYKTQSVTITKGLERPDHSPARR